MIFCNNQIQGPILILARSKLSLIPLQRGGHFYRTCKWISFTAVLFSRKENSKLKESTKGLYIYQVCQRLRQHVHTPGSSAETSMCRSITSSDHTTFFTV